LSRRTIFFVSDQTGVTAETMGHSLLTQFKGLDYRTVTLPFVNTVADVQEAARRIDAVGVEDGARPIVFTTLVEDDLRQTIQQSSALILDFFAAFLGPMEAELKMTSAHASGRSHGVTDLAAYTTRINAVNFAVANDDGSGPRDYSAADVILVGVSRTGKTPTSLYLALQYGIFAANYPLNEDDLEDRNLPAALRPHQQKLYGLTIRPERLQQIRNERRPNSRYASPAQVQFELREAQALFDRIRIPFIDTTECSVEEIASRIMDRLGLERRVRL
jgi:[pyruvate, water dikinase]-phosphate phosphotransferase / [pyruvate, water dikinase] kinase